MLNEYKEKLEMQREVLKALPRNNGKNNKLYKEKILELIDLYKKDNSLLIEEIEKRNKRYKTLDDTSLYDDINKQISDVYVKLDSINKYSSSFEKSKLDKILFDLSNFSSGNLEEVNENILKAIDIFKVVGIRLSKDDFNYSYYADLYMDKFLDSLVNNSIDNEVLKMFFDDIYWKCPDIISHIMINFKYLYYVNKKMFDLYYDKISSSYENIYNEYALLYNKRIDYIKNSKGFFIGKFLNKELDINNYTSDKINKAYNAIIKEGFNEKVNDDVINLLHSLYEYKNYLNFKYIIDDIRTLHKEKDKYKNIFVNKKKEINKEEAKLFKDNKKLFKMVSKGNMKKFNYYNKLINERISKIKVLYEELDKNYFLEKVSLLGSDSSLYDTLNLALSNFNYLNDIMKRNGKEVDLEIIYLKELVFYPYINIINNVLIEDEKDISLIIRDRYNLFGLDISEEEILIDNLDNTINEINTIIISSIMKRLGISENMIKFILNSENTLK